MFWHYTGFRFESLKIDALKAHWAARVLFVAILLLSVLPVFFPVGNPDFSEFVRWMDNVVEKGENLSSIEVLSSMPPITMGHLLNRASELGYQVLSLFLALIYAGFYLLNDKFDSPRKIVLETFKKTPSIIFIMFLFIAPLFLILVSMPFVVLLILPIFYFAPALIYDKKMPGFESMVKSGSLTQGYKFSIFFNLIMLSSMNSFASFLFALVLEVESKGFSLVMGFLDAFMLLAIARNVGVMYQLVTNRPGETEKV